MSMDEATVRHIANLARIAVSDDDVKGLQKELGSILGWVEHLREVDTSNVAPTANVSGAALNMREDEVSDGGYPDDILANAPTREGDFFVVAKVVE